MYLDQNLLTALDMLIEEASVTVAAERMRLSASAMSRTLGRIRKTTGDQILVRIGRTMTRTRTLSRSASRSVSSCSRLTPCWLRSGNSTSALSNECSG